MWIPYNVCNIDCINVPMSMNTSMSTSRLMATYWKRWTVPWMGTTPHLHRPLGFVQIWACNDMETADCIAKCQDGHICA